MKAYDIVIIGAGIMGISVAWHLTRADPSARIAVIEKDPSFVRAGTTATNSCLRQQFTTRTNIRVSQYTAALIRDFAGTTGDVSAPRVAFDPFGYLYLADTTERAEALGGAQALQVELGAGTVLLDRAALSERFPFMVTDDLVLGSLGTRDEGYFDGHALWAYWRKTAREGGVEILTAEVTAIERAAGQGRVEAVRLSDGTRLPCGWVVNASGGDAAEVAAQAGLSLPVERRKRMTWVFEAAEPLPMTLPLTIDPSGIHVRSDGHTYMVGAAPLDDGAADPMDFDEPPDLWEDHVWPLLAARIPAFERIRLRRAWAGHYDMNTVDANAILGPDPNCPNLIHCAGFSGHGLQQSPAIGRGAAELICHGRFEALDLSDFSPARLSRADGPREMAVI